ncbi:hypothetical protein DC421_02100 [Priestia megaterium]|nr:hypothetical protein DC428_10255 [Priestia megaterium]PVE88881.1 hypothetical protein DC421_02100 [Priestia megaterium]PVE92571.1 hypothetical protein DC426_03755 [Priestia megaterium]PVF01685.1 hypothetical protein DC433_00980 [Priestia megaterium]
MRSSIVKKTGLNPHFQSYKGLCCKSNVRLMTQPFFGFMRSLLAIASVFYIHTIPLFKQITYQTLLCFFSSVHIIYIEDVIRQASNDLYLEKGGR